MSVRLCVGEYASQPFCFEGLNLKVYCAEELCYALKENAFLLDTDIMSDRLVEWLQSQCGLADLAGELHNLVHRKGSLSAFVGRILEYTGFYSIEEIRQTEQMLKRGAGLNILEKRKLRIDHLTRQKKYLAAVAEYDALLGTWEAAMGEKREAGAQLKASILHNKGTALAGLMRYPQAADSFRRAYETDRDPESLKCFLAAKRMELSDNDYVAYAASVPGSAEAVLALEKQVEELNKEWELEADYLRLVERTRLREEDERTYLEENERVLLALKEDYRSMVS